MPHITVHIVENQLAGREANLIKALTAAVADVYGTWAHDLVSVRLEGVPQERWGLGGHARAVGPWVTFGIRAGVLDRPDADEIVARLCTSITDAVAQTIGEEHRERIGVELVPTPQSLVAMGGRLDP